MSDSTRAFCKYYLKGTDRKLVETAKSMLRRVIASGLPTSAQISSIAKVLHVFERLPYSVEVEPVCVTIMTPRRLHGDIETYFWWEFSQVEKTVRIRGSGHYSHPATGGDSFSIFHWEASPEYAAEYIDYSDNLYMVPDLVPFDVSVSTMNLAEKGYSVEVEDEGNPLLDDDEYDADDSVEPSDRNAETDAWYDDHELQREIDDSDAVVTSDGAVWTAAARDAAEHDYLRMIDPKQVSANAPEFAYGLDACCVCYRSLSKCGLAIDGKLKGRARWANFCAGCHIRSGEGIGWGVGQLYAQQADGSWRLVAGFRG